MANSENFCINVCFLFFVRLQVGGSRPPPRNRASLARLFKLNASLEQPQKDAIIDISSGGVIDICTSTMEGELVKFVMKCYDPELSQLVILERGKITVDGASIHRIWGLPKGGGKVVYDMHPDTIRLVHDMYDIPSGPAPIVNEWCDMICNMGDDADHRFLSAWLVIVFRCFLTPATSLKVSLRAYPSVLNPQDINKTDVCQFIVDQLRIAFMGLGDKKNIICCRLFHLVVK